MVLTYLHQSVQGRYELDPLISYDTIHPVSFHPLAAQYTTVLLSAHEIYSIRYITFPTSFHHVLEEPTKNLPRRMFYMEQQ